MLPTLSVEFLTAFRALCRAPKFSAVAVALLALGIGANVAVFSIFRSIVLRPLPFAEPQRLVGFSSQHAQKAVAQPALSITDFRDLRARSTAYAMLGAYRPDFVTYTREGAEPTQLICAFATEDFFRTLGVGPAEGRTFRSEEFSAAAPRTAVLSFAAWRRHFAGDRGVIGRTIALNQEPTTIVGIMPESFREPEFVDLWLPFAVEAPENLARDSRHWMAIGRLKPGLALASAQAEAAVVAGALDAEYPNTNRGWTIGVRPLRELRTGQLRNSLLMLVGAVGLVLAVACVNLANLLLARGVARMPEFAVRLSLGAAPASLARAVWLESVLLALGGAALGAALTSVALPAVAAQLPTGLVPRAHEIGVDRVVVGFAAALGLLTGIACGALPASQILRARVADLLKSGAARALAGGFARRMQSGLVVGQIALTLIVLAGAGLLMRSLLALQQTELGFEPRQLMTLRIAPGLAKWSDQAALALTYERILDELRRVPGVAAASLNCSAPLTGITLRFPYRVQGRPVAEGSSEDAVFNSVDPEYFKTLRVPLRQGRNFEPRDHESAAPVCIINEALAQRLFPGEDAIGKRLQIVPWLKRGYREIVGVVGDVKQDSQAEPPAAQIYTPSRQGPWFFTTLLVRTTGPVPAPALSAAVRRIDPMLGIMLEPMDAVLAATTAQPRLRAQLFGIFGATALLLSAFGLYASMAFSVNQRVREIGVRLALGATPGRVLGSVLGHAARLAGGGVALGLIGAVGFSGLLRGLLHGVSPIDPLVLASLALLLPGVALLSALAPALRAARLNPVQALQQE